MTSGATEAQGEQGLTQAQAGGLWLLTPSSPTPVEEFLGTYYSSNVLSASVNIRGFGFGFVFLEKTHMRHFAECFNGVLTPSWKPQGEADS